MLVQYMVVNSSSGNPQTIKMYSVVDPHKWRKNHRAVVLITIGRIHNFIPLFACLSPQTIKKSHLPL